MALRSIFPVSIYGNWEGVGTYLASRLIARLGSCCHAVVAKVFQAEVLSLLPCLLAYRWGFAHT